MDSIIELQRQTHEELERFERALYAILSRSYPTHEAQIKNAHAAAQILDRIDSRVNTQRGHYLDEEGRKAELDALNLGARAGGTGDELGEFYARLGKINEHYAKYPEAVAGAGFELELGTLLEEGNEDYEDYEEEDSAFSLPSQYD
jgi:splicing factor 3A subunit 3